MFSSKRKGNGTAIASIENELVELRARKSALQTKLEAADRDLAQAIADRRHHLLEADLDSNDAPKDIIGNLRDHRDAIGDALTAVDNKITAAQARLDAERDKIARDAESRLRTTQAAAIEAALQEYDRASKRLIETLPPVAGVSTILGGVEMALAGSYAQIIQGVAAVISETKRYASSVVDGGSPMHPQAPAQAIEVKAPPLPAVERCTIYLHDKHGKWREPDGSIRCACAWGQAYPPVDVADAAIANNLADYHNSPRARELQQVYGILHGSPVAQDCYDLETGQPPAKPAPSPVVRPLQHSEVTGTARLALPAR